jgi:hypothetical protein
MARYIGGSVAVAAAAMLSNAVTVNHQAAGKPKADSLAAGLAAASLMMALWCASGIALVVVLRRRFVTRTDAAGRAAAAANSLHTIPIPRSADAG